MHFKYFSLVVLGILIGASAKFQDTTRQEKTLTVQEFPDLVSGLIATPGCIDVKTTSLNDGKQLAIFAWFKNKAAVQEWYASPMHQGAMKKFFPNIQGRRMSLKGFKDEKAPLLVVATVTPSEKPEIKGSLLAISQIAIEIYTPAAGGLAFGGSFAPREFEVPGLLRID